MAGRFVSIPQKGLVPEMFVVSGGSSSGCIIVIHEVWGFAPHIQDVCERIGRLGFAALAPKLYWRDEQLFTSENIRLAMNAVWNLSLDERRDQAKVRRALRGKGHPPSVTKLLAALYSRSFRNQMLKDITSCASYAESNYGPVGVLGFSIGGGFAMRLAAALSTIRSCVSYYAEAPSDREIAAIQAPVLAIYAGHDEIINPKVHSFVHSAIKHRKDLTMKVFPLARHGFFGNEEKTSFDREAIEDSWNLVACFLERTMRERR